MTDAERAKGMIAYLEGLNTADRLGVLLNVVWYAVHDSDDPLAWLDSFNRRTVSGWHEAKAQMEYEGQNRRRRRPSIGIGPNISYP